MSFHHDKGEAKTTVSIELTLDEEEAKALRRSVDSRELKSGGVIIAATAPASSRQEALKALLGRARYAYGL